MKLVYLIGNGFDLKFGLKTRYTDFYQWYLRQNTTENKVVRLFKDSINSEYPLWSDLEFALGKYLSNVASNGDAIDIFDDVQTNLQRYVQTQNARSVFSSQSENVDFIRWFFDPRNAFRIAKRQQIAKIVDFTNINIETQIITFNYTSVIERLIGWEGSPLHYSFINSRIRTIKSIEHIHGYCSGTEPRMALGVNDISQIANEKLAENIRVQWRYVKPMFNDTYELNHSQKCLQWIREADVICIYGLSLGETDQMWWNTIAKRLTNQQHVLLFIHFYRDCVEIGHAGPKYQEQQLVDTDYVVKRLGLDPLIHSKEIQRIYITYSDDMFFVPQK